MRVLVLLTHRLGAVAAARQPRHGVERGALLEAGIPERGRVLELDAAEDQRDAGRRHARPLRQGADGVSEADLEGCIAASLQDAWVPSDPGAAVQRGRGCPLEPKWLRQHDAALSLRGWGRRHEQEGEREEGNEESRDDADDQVEKGDENEEDEVDDDDDDKEDSSRNGRRPASFRASHRFSEGSCCRVRPHAGASRGLADVN